MGKEVAAFIGILLMVFVVIFAYQFGLQALGSTDQGINLSGTQYQAPYNSSVNTSAAAYSFVSWEGYLLGIVALIFLLGIMFAPMIRRM
jgi:hypothetical protein